MSYLSATSPFTGGAEAINEALYNEAVNNISDSSPIENQVDNSPTQSEAQIGKLVVQAIKEKAQKATKAAASGVKQGVTRVSTVISEKAKKVSETVEDMLKYKQSKKFRVGIFVFWLIVIIAFAAMAFYVLSKGTEDKVMIWGIFIGSLIAHCVSLFFVYKSKKVASLAFSLIGFALGMVSLLKHEAVENVKCIKSEEDPNNSPYKVYMACHTFNVVLLFFSLLNLMAYDPRGDTSDSISNE